MSCCSRQYAGKERKKKKPEASSICPKNFSSEKFRNVRQQEEEDTRGKQQFG